VVFTWGQPEGQTKRGATTTTWVKVMMKMTTVLLNAVMIEVEQTAKINQFTVGTTDRR